MCVRSNFDFSCAEAARWAAASARPGGSPLPQPQGGASRRTGAKLLLGAVCRRGKAINISFMPWPHLLRERGLALRSPWGEVGPL